MDIEIDLRPDPIAPTGLVTSNLTSTGFKLDWDVDANATGGTNVFIVDTDAGSADVYITTLPAGTNTFDYSGTYGSVTIQEGGNYKAKIQALPDGDFNAFADIGFGSIVNSNAVVEHDCKLGRFVHICPGSAVAGGSNIGERTWVGIGATVRQMINIGADVVIGAGSVVVNDIPAEVIVIGSPAKVRTDIND